MSQVNQENSMIPDDSEVELARYYGNLESFQRYLKVTLLTQVKQATKKRRSLSGNSVVITKEFEPDDLQNSLYLRAYNTAIKWNRELTQAEVEHLCYLVGYQGYKPKLPMYRSKQFELTELLDGCDKNLSRQELLEIHTESTATLEPEQPATKVIRLALEIARNRLENQEVTQ